MRGFMPKTKKANTPTEVIRLRVRSDIIKKCREVQKKGARADDAESTFLNYLIRIGINIYEKSILPVENFEDDMEAESAKANGKENGQGKKIS
jgi:hypothetical protein